MRPRAVTELGQFTDAELHALRELVRNDSLTVGAVLDLAGRRVVVRGFDPASLPERRVYLTDAAGTAGYAVPVEDVQS
ncbi:MAG TPA: hypothetical protein VM184_00700 [Gaiellaceae bacterium]|nr:hypothetical protein [Gaiellaceae bacterium]